MELEELKLYLRVDSEDENSLISELQLGAEEYLLNAGVNKDYTKKLYKLAVKLLVNHWYDNRDSVLIGSISKSMEFSLASIITQLKYTQVDVITI